MEKAHHSFAYCLLILTVMMVKSCYGQTKNFTCPTASSIYPCTCGQYYRYSTEPITNRIALDCNKKNLTDSQVGAILNKVLLASGISPVIKITAGFNQLTRIPPQISKFSTLSFVEFTHNQITNIPPKALHLLSTTSVDIDLNFNKITSISSGAFKFPSASQIKLILDSNKIGVIPEGLFNFPSVFFISISLRFNQISVIPSGSFNYPSAGVVEIFLSSNNQITSIPSDAFNFPAATDIKLDLGYTQISAFPSGFFHHLLVRFVFIYLENIPIKSIPSFYYPSATYAGIYLNSNRGLTSIPSGVFNFPTAGQIRIEIYSSSIAVIDVGAFNFPNATSDIYLDFSLNEIRMIPSGIFSFPSAKSVFIEFFRNSIDTIYPGAFNFPSSEAIILNLSNNKISFIPPGTFDQGTYEYLELMNNKLKRFEASVFKSPLNSMLKKPIHGRSPELSIRRNPIDCSTDPCHVAWLFQSMNSSQLRSHLNDQGSDSPVCAINGGTSFSALDSFNFNTCPGSHK